MFKVIAGLSSNQLQAELSVGDDGSEEERVDNQDGFYAYVVKMPIDSKFYIAMTSHAFKHNICDWLGSIRDCYFL